MTVSTADELLEALAKLRHLFPDWRMGQLVANLTMAAGADDRGAIWDVTDEELLIAARRLIDRNRERRQCAVEAPDGGANGSPAATSQQPPGRVS